MIKLKDQPPFFSLLPLLPPSHLSLSSCAAEFQESDVQFEKVLRKKIKRLKKITIRLLHQTILDKQQSPIEQVQWSFFYLTFLVFMNVIAILIPVMLSLLKYNIFRKAI